MADQEIILRITAIRKTVAVIWLMFCVIFLCLGGYHYYLGFSQTPQIHVQPLLGGVRVNGVDMGQPLVEFERKFNEYLFSSDASASKQNFLTAAGYFAAFLTALFSAVLEFLPRDSSTNREENRHADEPSTKPRQRVGRRNRS